MAKIDKRAIKNLTKKCFDDTVKDIRDGVTWGKGLVKNSEKYSKQAKAEVRKAVKDSIAKEASTIYTGRTPKYIMKDAPLKNRADEINQMVDDYYDSLELGYAVLEERANEIKACLSTDPEDEKATEKMKKALDRQYKRTISSAKSRSQEITAAIASGQYNYAEIEDYVSNLLQGDIAVGKALDVGRVVKKEEIDGKSVMLYEMLEDKKEVQLKKSGASFKVGYVPGLLYGALDRVEKEIEKAAKGSNKINIDKLPVRLVDSNLIDKEVIDTVKQIRHRLDTDFKKTVADYKANWYKIAEDYVKTTAADWLVFSFSGLGRGYTNFSLSMEVHKFPNFVKAYPMLFRVEVEEGNNAKGKKKKYSKVKLVFDPKQFSDWETYWTLWENGNFNFGFLHFYDEAEFYYSRGLVREDTKKLEHGKYISQAGMKDKKAVKEYNTYVFDNYSDFLTVHQLFGGLRYDSRSL